MKALGNILKVLFSNITTIISGIFVAFLLPKIITKYDYGFYKIFTLYANYLGVLSLGIIDGIVLKYGALNYDELDRGEFRSYFLWYFFINSLFSLIIIFASLFIGHLDYKFIILLLGANLLPLNIFGYFQQISQITQRFKEYSIVRFLQAVSNILIVGGMFAIYIFDVATVTYLTFLIGLTAVNITIALWYIITYKDIIFGRGEGFGRTFKKLLLLIRMGFPLLLSNLCSILLLSLDRQVVSMFFPPDQYASYAFAYSILSLITVATSAVATVIYPMFKRIDLESLKSKYHILSSLLLIAVFAIILCFYPLHYFIEWFLPNYKDSLQIFRIILPGIAISSTVTVIMHNYYKTLQRSTLFFKKSIIAIIVATTLALGSYFIFKTKIAVSLASIVTLLIWFILSDYTLQKECGKSHKNLIYLLVAISVFYLCTSLPIVWVGCIVNVILLASITWVFYKKDIRKMLSFVFKK